MNKQNETPWRIICGIVIVVSALCFTPLVIPVGEAEPFFMGLPYTLWVGMLAAFFLVFMTYLGTKFHPGDDEF